MVGNYHASKENRKMPGGRSGSDYETAPEDQRSPGMDERSRRFSRIDLAEDRTLLANERTFAGWVRTSIGCIAIGVGFHALFNKMRPDWAPRAIASWFLFLGVVIVWLAVRRASAVMQRLNPHVIGSARKMNLELIASAVSLGAASLAAAIWLGAIG
jgi:putative membrane protein